MAQEALLETFPIKPINLDVAIRDQTFAPHDREIGIQAGFTVLRYGNLELRSIYQFFSIHPREFSTDQHSVFLNPRWNNFIDILGFPKAMPINRIIRHVLFGPMEDRAVPYIGGNGGIVLPSSGNDAASHLFWGQLGVRFPVTHGIAIEQFKMQTTIDLRSLQKTPASVTMPALAKELLPAFVAPSKEVLRNAQVIINQRGIGYKNFIPATYGSQAAARFSKQSQVRLKQTALQPRNPKNEPDDNEASALK